LARQIEGAKTRDVKARLADYPLDKLPAAEAVQQAVEQEKRAMLRAAAERQQEASRATGGEKAQQPENRQLTPAIEPHEGCRPTAASSRFGVENHGERKKARSFTA